MLTVSEFIKRLLPEGTRARGEGEENNWSGSPLWPPDLFAVAASLVDRSGCYTHPKYSGDQWGEIFFDSKYVELVSNLAISWGRSIVGEEEDPVDGEASKPNESGIQGIANAWRQLIEEDAEIQPLAWDEQPPKWCDAALLLMAVADEASAGIGFFIDENNEAFYKSPFIPYWMNNYSIKDIILFLRKSLKGDLGYKPNESERNELTSSLQEIFKERCEFFVNIIDTPSDLLASLEIEIELRYLTNSLCQLVPSSELCVQPKTRLSSVGCTVRSFSHHLALMPPISQVETFWRVPQCFEPSSIEAPRSLNLLLIPFPYTISATCFNQGHACVGSNPKLWENESANRARFFGVNQRWLEVPHEGNRQVTAKEFSDFIVTLVNQCATEVSQIHGIILPELALTSQLASEVCETIHKLIPGLEFFITGVHSPQELPRGPKNAVRTTVFEHGATRSWEQAKHHRWKLDKFQISRYHLGSSLDPHFDWWESIDLSPRECYFGVFRHEACLIALVCEDLARLDPVQSVVRSVAPNLCVCLLMDGPQLEGRWPGRYATVLADDPGCAVLTLTSLGLLKRTYDLNKGNSYNISLWKEAKGDKAAELSIPMDCHALLLTLSHKMDNAFTLDGRPDITKTVTLSRSATQPTKLEQLPSWMTGVLKKTP